MERRFNQACGWESLRDHIDKLTYNTNRPLPSADWKPVQVELHGGPLDGATFPLPAYPRSITFGVLDEQPMVYEVDGPPPDGIESHVYLYNDRHEKDDESGTELDLS
jgi:hypothetical protein